MSRRYFVTQIPVSHINGKIAPVSTIVHDNPFSSDSGGVSFVYGYKYASDEKSRFGIREKSRNLSKNPYTYDETANRTLFATSVNAVKVAFNTPQLKDAAKRQFLLQKKYHTLRGFAIAETFFNNGVYPFS